MTSTRQAASLAIIILALCGCDGRLSGFSLNEQETSPAGEHDDAVVKGPHGGRLLRDGALTLELAIFETGMPPEFRVWATHNDTPVPPQELALNVTLTRLGNQQDRIRFAPEGDYLRGDTVIYEPHSFEVLVEATHRGTQSTWAYENYEGRTRISSELAVALDLRTATVGAATITESVTVYGRVQADPARQSHVSARFDGTVRAVRVALGDRVKRGQTLAVIESDESLKPYEVPAPISGTVTEWHAVAGEQSAGRTLFTILDTSVVRVELAVFPTVRAQVRKGAAVTVHDRDGNVVAEGLIERLNVTAEPDQSVLATVIVPNPSGALVPGMYVSADINLATHAVPLAVRRSGLQSFRDFSVVYTQIGDTYEVRMLELGRQDAVWVEVLGGIQAGDRYVTTNSYVIKADIEKSGASHDH